MALECKLLLPQQQCDTSVIVAGEAESAVLCVVCVDVHRTLFRSSCSWKSSVIPRGSSVLGWCHRWPMPMILYNHWIGYSRIKHKVSHDYQCLNQGQFLNITGRIFWKYIGKQFFNKNLLEKAIFHLEFWQCLLVFGNFWYLAGEQMPEKRDLSMKI